MCSAAYNRGSEDPPRARILVVDDDGEMRDLLAEILADEGYGAEQAADGAEALSRLRQQPFAAVIMDKNMPGVNGLDLLPGLRALCPRTPVILISAFGDAGSFVDALREGAYEFLFKPFRIEELLRVVRQALASVEPVPPPLPREAA